MRSAVSRSRSLQDQVQRGTHEWPADHSVRRVRQGSPFAQANKGSPWRGKSRRLNESLNGCVVRLRVTQPERSHHSPSRYNQTSPHDDSPALSRLT